MISIANILSIGSMLFVFVILVVISVFAYFSIDLPEVDELQNYTFPMTSTVYDDDNNVIAEFAKEKRNFLPISDIPQNIIEAFIAIEDKTFYTNSGFDVIGIMRAFFKNIYNWSSQSKLAGGSTISQQLIKNMMLSQEQSLKRKIKEVILSYKVNQILSKEQILELYLNSIYMGNGVYGIGAAARVYFNKSVHELSLSEYALIAGLPQAPTRLNPIKNPISAVNRRNIVLENMLEMRYITQRQFAEAVSNVLRLNTSYKDTKLSRDYFVDYIKKEFLMHNAENVLHTSGLKIYTTLNSGYQRLAIQSLEEGILAYDKRNGWRGPIAHIKKLDHISEELRNIVIPKGAKKWFPAVITEIDSDYITLESINTKDIKVSKSSVAWIMRSVTYPLIIGDVVLLRYEDPYYVIEQIPEVSGSIIVMDVHTGEIKALVGGYDYDKSNFNFATSAMRQPGSVIKPFIYLTALENNFTPSTIISDSPMSFYNKMNHTLWRPQNYERNFLGDITLRRAFELSRNVATVAISQAVGLNKLSKTMKEFGVYKNNLPNLSAVLGSLETSPINITTAYASLGNKGIKVVPRFCKKIVNHQGRELSNIICNNGKKMQSISIASEQAAYQTISLLEGAVQHGTARKLNPISYPVAAKTGTSNQGKDHWFVAMTPDLVISVYVGHNLPQSLGSKETAAYVALPIAKSFLQNIEENLYKKPFSIPSDSKFYLLNKEIEEVRNAYNIKREEVFFEMFQDNEVPKFSVRDYHDITSYIPPKVFFDSTNGG